MNRGLRVPPSVATVALGIALAGGGALGAADDWPAILGPHRDGRSAETGLATSWPAQGPPLVWQVETGDGYSAPAVASGRLYLLDRIDDEERLRALDAATGKEIWSTSAPTSYEDVYGYSNGPRASPVVDGDLVFTYGVDGHLRCRRTADGSVVWQHDVNAEYGVSRNFFGTGSTPIAEGSLLLVMVGGSPPGSPDVWSGRAVPNGSAVVAFDKRSGEERWRVGDDLASYSSLVVTDGPDGRTGLAFARGGLLAFAADDGRELFQYPWRARRIESVNAATPVIVDREVFVTEAYGPGASLIRMKPGGYELVWRDPPGRQHSIAAHWSTPVYRDGYLYGSSGEKPGPAELRCIEWATGKVIWAQPGLHRTSQLLVDGHLVVLAEYGELLLVAAEPSGYRELARAVLADAAGRRLLRYPAWAPPALANGLLYLRAEGRLVALRLAAP